MKILLLNPPIRESGPPKHYPLGLCLLGAILDEAGYEVALLDANAYRVKREQVRIEARSALPDGADTWDMIGIGNLISTYAWQRDVIPALKRDWPKAKIIAGGGCATALGAQMLEWIPGLDAVCVGEGEKVVKQIADQEGDFHDVKGVSYRNEKGEITINPPVELLTEEEFDQLPFPKWELAPLEQIYFPNSSVALSKESLLCRRRIDIEATRGCPYICVAADTWVQTSDGFMRLGDSATLQNIICDHGTVHQTVEQNYLVQSLDGKARASRVIFNGLKECMRVTLRNGLWLEGTPDHQIRTVRNGQMQWLAISQLTSEDFVPVSIGSDLWPTQGGLDQETGWVLGYLIGDGWIGENRLGFAVTRYESERLSKFFQTRFGYTPKIVPHKQTDKIKMLWVNSKSIATVFNTWIDRKDKLRVPPLIRFSQRETVLSFLKGLWDADGTEDVLVSKSGTRTRNYLVTVSAQLAHEVQLLLMALGHKAAVLGPYKSGGYSVTKDKPIIGKTRYMVYTDLLKQYETIPVPYSVYHCKKCGKWHQRTRKSKLHRGVRRQTLMKAEPFNPLLLNNVFYVRVREVKSIGTRPVYDLSVEMEHNYASNAIFSHNCNFCTDVMTGNSRTGYQYREKFRMHSPEYVAEMIAKARMKLAIDFVLFVDENFDTNRAWVAKLMDALEDYELTQVIHWGATAHVNTVTPELLGRMRECGCAYLDFGMESGSDPILRYIKKNATRQRNQQALDWALRVGINPLCNFMLGQPIETVQTIYDTASFLQKNGILVKPFYATPYPATELYYTQMEKLLRKCGTLEKFMLTLGDATDLAVNLTQFTDSELYGLRELVAKHDLNGILEFAKQRGERIINPDTGEELVAGKLVPPDKPVPLQALRMLEDKDYGMKKEWITEVQQGLAQPK